jgi:tRNA A-37 threonylcarbamoyl transferase component Bud32
MAGSEHVLIQVGQVLDKYELLERVGQGGMAIVYRGIDRTLKRTVAIKVLHKHLSDYQEARDRFEREAQAVAKLRHENILEIFDYAARADSEAYIVTEFIDGQTLKQFVTERPVTYPEVGALIMLQVARALAHAHAGGILHRDVKPENIMIRSDGVVKLMDFGISHMVDLERLTVTGQLLGSPAYMAPEHVEGRPLDFRTDVFAVGIVLYQLTVGKLPFEGKNPHEVLKRIAECKFVDPRVANPRIGNRLGRIILRAMAAAPDDRYSAIGEMVLALEAYLEESGLEPDKATSELARYFKGPVAYELALKERLVDHLTRRGQKLLADGDQAPALDVFDRVLTIDPENARVLGILDGLNRRTRLKRASIAILAVGAISLGGYMIHRRSLPPPPEAPPEPVLASVPLQLPVQQVAAIEAPPEPQVLIDAGVAVAIGSGDGASGRPTGGTGGTGANGSVPDAPDAGLAAPATVDVPLRVNPAADTQVRIAGGPWQNLTGDTVVVPVTDQPVDVELRNACCEARLLRVDRNSKPTTVALQFFPARLTPRCNDKTTSVSIDGVSARLDEYFPITFPPNAMGRQKTVRVTFTGDQGSHSKDVTVTAAMPSEVSCEP